MSAIQTVVATINGQQYTLTYNSSSGAYEASVTAPSTTSWNNAGHYYPVTITATDISGNSATIDDTDSKFGSSLQLRVKETVKPVVTFVSPTTGAGLTNNKPTFTVNVTDAGSGVDLSTFKLKVGNSTVTIDSCTQSAINNGFAITYTPTAALSDGVHTITANVSDYDGNAATQASINITIDTVPPTLTVTAPADQIYVNNSACTVTGTTNDATSSPVTVTITLNGSDVGAVSVGANGAFSKSITLSEGENTIVITATDALGKYTSVTRTVYLDTSAPEFTSVTIAPNPVNTGATYTITVKVAAQ